MNFFDIKYSLIERIHLFFLSSLIFLIPVSQYLVVPVIVLWSISSVVLILKTRLKLKTNFALIGLIMFYASLIFGLAWTDNMSSGLFDLEVKFSLLLFPFMFLFIDIKMKELIFLLKAFLVGLLVKGFWSLGLSCIRFSDSLDGNDFFYVNFTNGIHPSYFSMYLTLGLAIILADLKGNMFNMFKKKYTYFILSIILFFFIILSLSKAGVICSIILVFYYILKWMIEEKSYLKSMSILVFIILILFGTYSSSNYFNHRANELISTLFSSDSHTPDSSSSVRLKIWSEAGSLIYKRPLFGYGTGDVKSVLMERYQEKGMTGAYDKGLNAHNQFLQVFISVGLVGFLLFNYVLYESCRLSIKYKNALLLNFVFITVFFMLTESILENQAGTIFFGIFICLLNQKLFFKKTTT